MAQWRTLPVAESPGLPPLLVSATFTASSYRILVSDLAHVWVEELDRRSICMRGWKENTVIDPSDTPENMERFLGYLRSALDDSNNNNNLGGAATALKVSGYAGSETGDDGILLEIECELDGLDQQLRWPVYLRQTAPTGLATELVLPLLRAQSARTHEIEALANLLRHKDNVISKLLDALEAANIGLERAFPALAPGSTVRKKVSRSAAEDKVQGLAPFQLSQWQEDVGDVLSPRLGGVAGLVDDVFGPHAGVRYDPGRDSLDGVDLAGWWRGYRGTAAAGRKKTRKGVVEAQNRQRTATPSPPPVRSDDGDDDEFQVQVASQHVRPGRPSHKKSSPAKPAHDADAESTASEASPTRADTSKLAMRAPRNPEPVAEDDDDEFQRQATPPPRLKPKPAQQTRPATATARSPAKLGSLGGSRTVPTLRSPLRSPPTKPAPSLADDESTASEAEDPPPAAADDDVPEDDVLPKPAAPAATPSKRGGLGRIGGKMASSSPRQPEPSSTTETADPAPLPPARRLGKIGGGGPKLGSIGSPAATASARGRSREVPSKTEEEAALAARETSAERANRIRDELKAERDRKAAAGPVKKKRRF